MLLLFHGAAGGLDEIAIAVVALGVLWIAVKLAGRKPASEEDEHTPEPEEEGQEQPSNPTPTMKSN